MNNSVKLTDLMGGGVSLQFSNGTSISWNPPEGTEPFSLFVRDGNESMTLPLFTEHDANAVQQFFTMAMEAARDHIENTPEPGEVWAFRNRAQQASEMAQWLKDQGINPRLADQMRAVAVDLHTIADVRLTEQQLQQRRDERTPNFNQDEDSKIPF